MLKLPGLPLLCLYASMQTAAAFTKSTGGSSKTTSSSATASHFGPMDLGLGADGDLPALGQNGESSSGTESILGEGVVGGDEMLDLRKAPPMALRQVVRPQPFLSKAAKPLALTKVQEKGLLVGASLDSGSSPIESTPQQIPSVPAAPTPKVVEEYDVVDDDNEDDDDYRTVKMDETKTREELDRVQRGDVEHVKPAEHKKKPMLIKRRSVTSQQQSKAAVHEVAVEAAEQAPGSDKMMGQCMAFASWVKGQGSTGPDLVRIWKGTCMPAVMAGNAPPAYSNMCNALGTAVSKFAVRPWSPTELCQAVLAVFKESGVGATPLR